NMARLGQSITYGEYGAAVRKVRIGALDPAALLEADQVICGTHRTRRKTNVLLKETAGFDGPLPTGGGEKIIALKNQHALRIYNGQFIRLDKVVANGGVAFTAAVSSDDGEELGEQDLYAGHFLDHVAYDEDRGHRDERVKRHLVEADWGWAITCHKAQGS